MTKFYKFSLKKLFKKLNFEPHTAQQDIIDLTSDYRFVIVAAGRRFGKSKLAAHLGFAKLLEPNTHVGVVAPSYNLSTIIFNEIAKIVRDTGIETIKFSYKEHYIELPNGSWLKGYSSHKPDSLVGRGFDFLIMDEFALTKEPKKVWELQLRPTMSDNPNSRVLFISSPRGSNYFKDLFNLGKDPEHEDYVCYHAPTSANPTIDKKEIEAVKRTNSPEYFAQEYLAQFVTFEGQIYSKITKKDLSNLKLEHYEIIAGLDFGLKHSTACVVVATDDDNFYVIDEYKKANKTTAEHAEWLRKAIDTYDIYNIYRDHAAAQSAYDLAQLYDIDTVSANKSVIDGIKVVNGLFNNNKLVINDKCTELLHELANYHWKDNSVQERPVKENDDLCDALRYAIYTYYISKPGIMAL